MRGIAALMVQHREHVKCVDMIRNGIEQRSVMIRRRVEIAATMRIERAFEQAALFVGELRIRAGHRNVLVKARIGSD